MQRAWSKAAEQKLRELYGRGWPPPPAFLLKRTVKAVRSRAKVLGLKTGRIHRWTPAEFDVLRRRYPHEKTATIAKDLRRPLHQVFNAAKRIGLDKTPEYLASPDACRLRRENSPGAQFRFKKGQVPANKGLRRPGYAPGRMATTQFKKGQRGNKWVPIGTEVVTSDGYLARKVAEGPWNVAWKQVHRLIWIEAKGPIPKDHLVVFKDRDRTHVKLANLELITRAENARRNRMWNKYPKELAQIIQLRGAVNRQINKRLGRQETHRDRAKAARRAVRNARRLARQGQADGPRSSEGDSSGR